MIVSHNEILVTCQKALEARGFSLGIREDAADSIAWLAQIGVDVLPDLCAGIEQLRPVTDGWQLSAESSNQFILTTGGSCLQFGSLAADYARAQAHRLQTATGRIDGSEPSLWIGYLRHLTGHGLHCSATWQQGAQRHQIQFTAHAPFPDYASWELGPTEDRLVQLAVSQLPLPPMETGKKVKRVPSVEFATKRTYHLYNGIEVDDQAWQLLTEIAKGVLVEDTALSRERGAGGQ